MRSMIPINSKRGAPADDMNAVMTMQEVFRRETDRLEHSSQCIAIDAKYTSCRAIENISKESAGTIIIEVVFSI